MPFETIARTQSVFSGNVQEARDWLKGFFAVSNSIGVRMRDLPMTPGTILSVMEGRHGAG